MTDLITLPCWQTSGQSLGRLNVSEHFDKVNNVCPMWAELRAGTVPEAPVALGLKIGPFAVSVLPGAVRSPDADPCVFSRW